MMTKSCYTWSICFGLAGGLFVPSSAMTDEQLSGPSKTSVNLQSDQINKANDQQIEMWKKEAVQVANDYVTTLDQGQYAQSWEKGGPGFKMLVSQQKWVDDLNHMRAPLGKVISRQVDDNEVIKDPYHLLNDKFIVIEYVTMFENAPKKLREILLLRLDPDSNRWHVGSYEILDLGVKHNLDSFIEQKPALGTLTKPNNIPSSLPDRND